MSKTLKDLNLEARKSANPPKSSKRLDFPKNRLSTCAFCSAQDPMRKQGRIIANRVVWALGPGGGKTKNLMDGKNN